MSDEIKNKIDDGLFSFYLEADKNAINDLLKDDIGNPDTYQKKKKRIIFLAMAKAKKKHNEYLLELANKFQEALLLNSEKPIALLKGLIQGNASLSFYRNLDKLTREDIIEIIKDKNLVQLLEELEGNDKSH